MTGHEFAPSGRSRINARGRALPICLECDAPNLSPVHWPKLRGLEIAPKSKAKPGARLGRPPGSRTKRPADTHLPWQLRMLAIACDQAMIAGPDVVGWRAFLEAKSLRDSITEMPADPIVARELRAVPTAAEPEIAAQRVEILSVAKPTISRARNATKGIRSDRMRALAVRAISLGAQPTRRGDHLRLTGGPLQAPVTISTTSNGLGRSWLNLKAAAKRAGLDVAGL